MCGFITERDFDAAEHEFPGIQRLYESLVRKPHTFLELVWKYEEYVMEAGGRPEIRCSGTDMAAVAAV